MILPTAPGSWRSVWGARLRRSALTGGRPAYTWFAGEDPCGTGRIGMYVSTLEHTPKENRFWGEALQKRKPPGWFLPVMGRNMGYLCSRECRRKRRSRRPQAGPGSTVPLSMGSADFTGEAGFSTKNPPNPGLAAPCRERMPQVVHLGFTGIPWGHSLPWPDMLPSAHDPLVCHGKYP